VKTETKMSNVESRKPGAIQPDGAFAFRLSALGSPHAFSLIEVLVVVSLLSLIVLALMAVFNSTQRAFRASITQTDVLESGRATMDLISTDLRQMTPSAGVSNSLVEVLNGFVPVNFYASNNFNFQPLVQSLAASLNNPQRTNVLENFFILSRENQTWTGTGYVVDPNSTNFVNPLYRFSISTNVQAASPAVLYTNFANRVFNNNFTNMSHLMDGVVHLTVRAYDPNGYWMTNTFNFADGQISTNNNVLFSFPFFGEVGFYMFGNMLPASVEIQLGALEDRTLQRAESLPVGTLRDQYLQLQAGKLHIFRQRVSISNVDPAAYQ
jgi:prepilin-type N-terminal cleavage/methylation domain-containing protein